VGGGRSVEEESSRFGLPVDLIAEAEEFRNYDGIYPDNIQTVEVFAGMITQWIMGPTGPVGINYVPLDRVMRSCKVVPSDEDEVFWGFQVMERAALKTIRARDNG